MKKCLLQQMSTKLRLNFYQRYHSFCSETQLDKFFNEFCDFIPLSDIDNMMTYTKYLIGIEERIARRAYFVKSKVRKNIEEQKIKRKKGIGVKLNVDKLLTCVY